MVIRETARAALAGSQRWWDYLGIGMVSTRTTGRTKAKVTARGAKAVATPKAATPKTATPKAAKPKAGASNPTPSRATADVADAWARIERWFAAHHPTLALKLRPAATPKQLAAAEQALGVSFPADFRASLLVHDGQENDPDVRLLPFAQRLGSLESLTRCWKDDRKLFDQAEMAERIDWLDASRRVRQVQLHPKHIAIAGSKYWDYERLLLDFRPGPNGSEGQVIARDDVDHRYVCIGIGELLARTARGLEDGAIEVRASIDDSVLVYLAKPRGTPVSPTQFYA